MELIYLDANHREAPTLRYFQQALPHLHPQGIMVLDDIHWSRGMYRAWQQIIQHPQVRISIDLFEAGLLFFDPSLPKAQLRWRVK